MSDENDDVLKANAGAPAADIPDLRKKDTERKKAGVAWSGARGAAGQFPESAAGISRVAASAATAVNTAAPAAGLLTRLLAAVTGTLLGKVAAAGAVTMMVGLGFVATSRMKSGDAAMGGANLGAISTSLRVRTRGADRVSVASKGEIRFDPLSPVPSPVPEPEKPVEQAQPVEPPQPQEQKLNFVPDPKLSHNLSGAKLSSSLGGNFGNKNIFSGDSAEKPRFNQGLSKVNVAKSIAPSGKLSSFQTKSVKLTAAPRTTAKAHTSRAIGQLKMARGMSMQGAQSNNAENAAAASQGAFDQQQTMGGAISGGGLSYDATTAPSGTGAPDAAPSAPAGTATDPALQNSLNQIGSMADQARQFKQMAKMLLGIGLVLIAIGAALLFPPVHFIGLALIAAGVGLLAMGAKMNKTADSMAAMAKSMGSALSTQINNTQQGAVINYCTDQALAGTAVKDCNPPESITQVDEQAARTQSDVEKVKKIGADTPVIEGATQ